MANPFSPGDYPFSQHFEDPAEERTFNGYRRDSDGLKILPGRLYSLPKLDPIAKTVDGRYMPDSVLWRQSHVNDRVAKHPLLVWDTRFDESRGVMIARCLQATSFTDHNYWYDESGTYHMTVEEKYYAWKAWYFHLQYVAIDHPGMSTPEHKMPVLRLTEASPSMDHLTYVHLDHFFEVEADFLEKFGKTKRELGNRSFSILMYRLDRFMHNSPTERQTKRLVNGDIRSPLDNGYVLPFSPWIRRCSDFGRNLERDRLGETPFMTGHELAYGYFNENDACKLPGGLRTRRREFNATHHTRRARAWQEFQARMQRESIERHRPVSARQVESASHRRDAGQSDARDDRRPRWRIDSFGHRRRSYGPPA